MRKTIVLLLTLSLGLITESGCSSSKSNHVPQHSQASNKNAQALTVAPENELSTSNSTRTEAQTPEAELPKGYLSNQDNMLIYLNWTESDNNLTGQASLIWVKEDKSGQQEMDNESVQFTGVLDKSSISLNIKNSVTWTGTLENHTLTLAVPSGNGMISTYVFKPATIQNYNDALTVLRDRVVSENTKRFNEKKSQEEEKTRNEKAQSLNDAVISYDQKLGHNISLLKESIQDGVGLDQYDSILNSYKQHWNTMQAHYQKQLTNSNKSQLTDEDIYQASNDLYDMSNDKYDISNDKYDFDNMTDKVNQYISSLKDGIQYTQVQWANLQKALTNNPNGTAKASYTIEQVESLIRQAQNEISKVTTVVKAKSLTAASYEKKADDLYNKADAYQATLTED